jgi:hypothetical protein
MMPAFPKPKPTRDITSQESRWLHGLQMMSLDRVLFMYHDHDIVVDFLRRCFADPNVAEWLDTAFSIPDPRVQIALGDRLREYVLYDPECRLLYLQKKRWLLREVEDTLFGSEHASPLIDRSSGPHATYPI